MLSEVDGASSDWQRADRLREAIARRNARRALDRLFPYMALGEFSDGRFSRRSLPQAISRCQSLDAQLRA